jgi:hypothetical protein
VNRQASTLPVIAGSLALVLVGALALAAVPAQRGWNGWDDERDMRSFKTETVAKTWRAADPSKPAELIVDNLYGPITVEAAAGPDIVLEAKKTVFARDEARAAKAEEEVRLDLTQKGNTVEAYVDGPFREQENEHRNGDIHMHRDPGYRVHYAFTVKVPVKTDLVLKTVIEGDIVVRGVEGAFDLRNVTGKVRLIDAAGAGEAQSVSDGVTVDFRRRPAGPCTFKSVSGDVEVDLPGPPSADVRFKTMNGEVYSDFEVTRLPQPVPVKSEGSRSENGRYRYRNGGYTAVRVGQGGPEITLETLTGDILIARRSK